MGENIVLVSIKCWYHQQFQASTEGLGTHPLCVYKGDVVFQAEGTVLRAPDSSHDMFQEGQIRVIRAWAPGLLRL